MKDGDLLIARLRLQARYKNLANTYFIYYPDYAYWKQWDMDNQN